MSDGKYRFKIVLVGHSIKNKNKFAQDFFNYQIQYSKFQFNITTKEIEFRPSEFATISIWIISNKFQYDLYRERVFFKGSVGAIILFDLSIAETYTMAQKLYEEIKKKRGEIPFILIGMNAHLIDDIGEVIDRSEAREFAENHNGIYIEISPKTYSIVEEAFIDLTRRIIYLWSQ